MMMYVELPVRISAMNASFKVCFFNKACTKLTETSFHVTYVLI